MFCILISLFAVVGTYANDRANERQDDQRITDNAARADDNARLLACFDDFADTLAGGLPLVREANAARNAAQSQVFISLQALLAAALTGERPIPDDVAAVVIKNLVEALAAYRAADAQLTQVQADNPVPDAPSKFCNDLP